ncbi:MAG: phosphotransferase [candidate division Zixibacteria bacterium]|nr:phosphotransferase [candidate division Zixibacteria bacterium]
MAYKKEIDENFRFLILAVRSQLQDALNFLDDTGTVSNENFFARDDYIDNLKGVIETKCFSQIHYSGEPEKKTVDLIKAVIVITTNLERIADYSVNMIGQMHHLHDTSFIRKYDYREFFDIILESVDLIYKAAISKDLQDGLHICKSELTIDSLYKEVFQELLAELKTGKNTEDLLTTIFIFRYLERMGDCLLNVGEAIISSAMGEKFKFDQFEALEESIQRAQIEASISDFTFDSIWETRSGCRIARVRTKNGNGSTIAAIFKEGQLKKLEDEKNNIEKWQEIIPGLPPRIYSFKPRGENASILLEYIDGNTLEDLLLSNNPEGVKKSLGLIKKTLNEVYESTRKMEPVNARPSNQLLERIREVHEVHPDYKFETRQIGSIETPSFDEMLKRLSEIDESIYSPFTVFIHGDFNIDNIILDKNKDTIHFIDLHRSKNFDYVQDISVFMVSTFRLPVKDDMVRNLMNLATDEIYRFGAEFAQRNNDTTFEARLTLGLIRSFTSSTRFELKEEFAKTMYLRAIYLIEKMLSHEGKPWEEFRLPSASLVY